MKRFRRTVLVSVLVATIALSWGNAASAEPVASGLSFTAVPGVIAGSSPDGLGAWGVHYQRIDGGNPDVAAAINEGIDAEATRQVQRQTWDGSTRRPWTFDAYSASVVEHDRSHRVDRHVRLVGVVLADEEL
jgi:hypothetical protein